MFSTINFWYITALLFLYHSVIISYCLGVCRSFNARLWHIHYISNEDTVIFDQAIDSSYQIARAINCKGNQSNLSRAQCKINDVCLKIKIKNNQWCIKYIVLHGQSVKLCVKIMIALLFPLMLYHSKTNTDLLSITEFAFMQTINHLLV